MANMSTLILFDRTTNRCLKHINQNTRNWGRNLLLILRYDIKNIVYFWWVPAQNFLMRVHGGNYIKFSFLKGGNDSFQFFKRSNNHQETITKRNNDLLTRTSETNDSRVPQNQYFKRIATWNNNTTNPQNRHNCSNIIRHAHNMKPTRQTKTTSPITTAQHNLKPTKKQTNQI